MSEEARCVETVVFSVASDGDMKNMWLLDSGVRSHMTFDRDGFCTLLTVRDGLEVVVTSGDRLPVCGTGSISLILESGRTEIVSNMLFIPGLDLKLLSVSALKARGAEVYFEDQRCSISFEGQEVARGKHLGNLYVLSLASSTMPNNNEANLATMSMTESTLCHARLGHFAHDCIAALNNIPEDVPPISSAAVSEGPFKGYACGTMCVSKYIRTSGIVVKTNSPFEVLQSDLMGPIDVASKGGARYIVVSIDDPSRYVQVYLVKRKSKVLEKLKNTRHLWSRS